MKKLFSLLLAGLMIVSLSACSDKKEEETDLDEYLNDEIVIDEYTNEVTGETFHFADVTSDTVKITKYEGPDLPHAVEIPSEVSIEVEENGVTRTITKTITGIDDLAFYALSNITEVKIPNTITLIGDMAFAECRQLTSVTIPVSVQELGQAAFKGCVNLKSITFEAGSKMTAIPDAAFMHCTALESLTVPGNIETIGKAAFQGCESLKSIVIEEGVKVIGEQAFQNCKALEALTLPASLTEIKASPVENEKGEEEAKNFNFWGCEALYIENVTVPADANSVAAKYIASLKLQNKPVEEPAA